MEDALERPYASVAATALSAVRPDASPVDAEPLGRGNRKRTVAVRLDGAGRVVVQLSDDPAALQSEATLLSAVRDRTSVPVPPVLAAGTADGVGYLVTPRVDGDDLHERFVGLEPPVRARVARSFGRHLARLHEAFGFDGHGRLAVDGDDLVVAEPADRRAWLADYGRRALERLPPAFDPVRPALASLFADPDVGPARATLFPWDLRPGNALVADGEVTAVLDWEAPLAAAAALSVAKAEYLVADWYVDDPAPLRSAFAAGYNSVRPYPDPEPVHRAAAVADSAVDSRGEVTTPGYPEVDRETAVAFHRRALASVV
jgi:Ser/Thr protein kinase RdoA (MazF antagonist)